MFIGIFIFAEGYPLWEGFYKAKNLGSPLLNELIGSSRGVLTLMIIVVALAMFWVGEWSEKKFARDDYKINQH
jgi:hypothetical protein